MRPITGRATISRADHRGPNPGFLALVFMVLFIAGLYFVVSFRVPEHLEASQTAVRPYFPGPWESAQTIATYFQTHPHQVLLCAFFQFGAAIPLGLYTATMTSRLRLLGVKAAGAHIALFGGFLTVFNLALSALLMWVMAYPGVAQDGGVIRALYYMVYAIGGVGYSVPLGLLIAGIAVSGRLTGLLSRWLFLTGLALGVCGELSFFNLLSLKVLFLIPLTRFPGFLWLIAAGFVLPRSVGQREVALSRAA